MTVKALLLAAAALTIGACASTSDPELTGMVTQAEQQPQTACREERATGSNLKKRTCKPPRDDSTKLGVIGVIDTGLGHGRAADGTGH